MPLNFLIYVEEIVPLCNLKYKIMSKLALISSLAAIGAAIVGVGIYIYEEEKRRRSDELSKREEVSSLLREVDEINDRYSALARPPEILKIDNVLDEVVHIRRELRAIRPTVARVVARLIELSENDLVLVANINNLRKSFEHLDRLVVELLLSKQEILTELVKREG